MRVYQCSQCLAYVSEKGNTNPSCASCEVPMIKMDLADIQMPVIVAKQELKNTGTNN